MNDKLAAQVKEIYSAYHAGQTSPEETLDKLELAIAESNE
jgi:hypothetical protein